MSLNEEQKHWGINLSFRNSCMPLSWVGLVCCMWVGISRCWWPNWSWRISERSATWNIHIHAFCLSPINLIERPCLSVCHWYTQPITNGNPFCTDNCVIMINLEFKIYDWARPWGFGTGSMCIVYSASSVNCSPLHWGVDSAEWWHGTGTGVCSLAQGAVCANCRCIHISHR